MPDVADLPTVDIPDVELLSEGFWNGEPINAQMLSEMVEAHAATFPDLLQPTIKLGHNEDQPFLDGFPSFGFVSNLRLRKVKGVTKLVGDLVGVPEKLAELVKAGAYSKRSAEIWFNLELGDEKYPSVLTGLALLGDDLPAVDTLDDIRSLYKRLHLSLDKGVRAIPAADVSLSSSADDPPAPDDNPEGSTVELSKLVEALGLDAEADEATVLSAIGERVTLVELRKALGLDDDADRDAVFGRLSELAAEKVELSRSHEQLKDRVAELTTAVHLSRANDAVESLISGGRLLPRQRQFAVDLHMEDNADKWSAYVDQLPERAIDFAAKGTDTAPELSDLEPTESERAAAEKAYGRKFDEAMRRAIIKQKARDMGQPAPTFED